MSTRIWTEMDDLVTNIFWVSNQLHKADQDVEDIYGDLYVSERFFDFAYYVYERRALEKCKEKKGGSLPEEVWKRIAEIVGLHRNVLYYDIFKETTAPGTGNDLSTLPEKLWNIWAKKNSPDEVFPWYED